MAAPKNFQPSAEFLAEIDYQGLTISNSPVDAVKDADVVNTDVWLSMGEEGQSDKEAAFSGYQVNAELLEKAKPECMVLHCLPAYRGKEITEEVLELHASTIFQQAENRLHAQKAVLQSLV